jgi:hypothetical protein
LILNELIRLPPNLHCEIHVYVRWRFGLTPVGAVRKPGPFREGSFDKRFTVCVIGGFKWVGELMDRAFETRY